MKYAFAFLFIFAWNCSSRFPPEQDAYMKKALAHPLLFTVPKEDEVVAWGRAESFIEHYSTMRLQVVNDYELSTMTPTYVANQTVPMKQGVTGYGYIVRKTLMGPRVQFEVVCVPAREDLGASSTRVNTNAHILAYYIATNELPYPTLIYR